MGLRRLRIGILGRAGISKRSMLQPWRDGADIEVRAIASRDAATAARYASEHGIEQSFGSYEELLREADIDAVYIPLPNSLHREWVIASLRAGFPVLCEKPLACNAIQAAQMAAVAEQTGLPLIEAFHWRAHPVAVRMLEIVSSNRIGTVRSMHSWFRIPGRLFRSDNIRFNFELGGGSMMDNGCYCVDLMRMVAGEPMVVRATATISAEQIDGAMRADLRFPGDIDASLESTMIDAGDSIDNGVRITGDRGELTIRNPFIPGLGSTIRVTCDQGFFEESPTSVSSFIYQANAFSKAVRDSAASAQRGRDGVANMRVIDEIYRAAGLRPRA